MSSPNPYNPPLAEVGELASGDSAVDRKKLIPLWIKIFGWVFMVMGAGVLVMAIVAVAIDQPASYDIFGLHYRGSPLDPIALLISAIILSLAVSAYGLLFARPWGLNACLVTGYGGVAICLGTTAYSAISHGSFSLRLEPLVQVPYLLKLHRIRPLWLRSERRTQ